MDMPENGQTVASGGAYSSIAGFPPVTSPGGHASAWHAVAVAGSAISVRCPPGINLLEAFERSRCSQASTVLVGCRRGGCGVCKVRVLDGEYRTSAMSRAHVTDADQANGMVLACCVYPETDLTVEAVPVGPRKLK